MVQRVSYLNLNLNGCSRDVGSNKGQFLIALLSLPLSETENTTTEPAALV